MVESTHAGIFRDLSAALDRIVYSFIKTFYEMLMDLANIDILSDDTVSQFYSKIYLLIGLFMLFKVSFSFINYIVNPDLFLDKQKGAKRIFINIILSLAMLSIAPFGFSLLSQFQSAILADNIIPRFFLTSNDDHVLDNEFYISDKWCAETNGKKNEKSIAATQGDFIAILSFRPFFQPDSEHIDEKKLKVPEGYCTSRTATVSSYLDSDIYNAYDKGINGKDHYVIDYKIFISTISGVVIALLLLSFCFDVAVRSIKLGFLELIAPVPIISYMDPKSGKDGMFSKWIKEVWSTWLDLFVRLSAIFLAIFIIGLLDSNQISGIKEANTPEVWLMLFIIIGALMFAKKLPSLIESITGIKLSNSIQLNPFKKVSNEALGGKAIVGGVGAVGAAGLGLGMAGVAHGFAYANKRKEFAKTVGNFTEAKSKLNGINDQLTANKARYANLHRRDNELNRQIAAASSDSERIRLQAKQNHIREKMSATDRNISNLKSQRAEAKHAFETAQNKLNDANKSKLYRHPIRGAIGEMSASAYSAMKAGYKNPAKVFGNAYSGTKTGIDRRNYYEKYDFADKMHDKFTDFTGIRGDSGTTSEIKNEIKRYKNQLASTEQYIEMLNRNISNTAGASFGSAVIMRGDKFDLDPSYAGANRDELNNIINTYNEQIEARANIESNINKLEKLQSQGKPDKK